MPLFGRGNKPQEDQAAVSRKELAMLSGAALWEERLDTRSESRDCADRLQGSGSAPSDADDDGDDDDKDCASPHLKWGDVEKSKFEEQSAATAELLAKLRRAPNALARAQVVAKHTLARGDLTTEEARLVFALNKHKKIEEEHMARMGDVAVDDSEDEGESSSDDSSGGFGGGGRKKGGGPSSSMVVGSSYGSPGGGGYGGDGDYDEDEDYDDYEEHRQAAAAHKARADKAERRHKVKGGVGAEGVEMVALGVCVVEWCWCGAGVVLMCAGVMLVV